METTLIITIKSTQTRRETTSKGNELIKQQAAINVGLDYPLPFDLTIHDPYPPGQYYIAPQSFRVSRWNSLELDPYGLVLLPIEDKPAK